MLAIEREIAYDIMGEQIERTEQQILNEEVPLIESSDVTAFGVAVPEVLVTEEDASGEQQPDQSVRRMNEDDDCDMLLATAGKNHSLVEFM